VSLTPTLIPERTEDEGAAKQDHSPYLPLVRFVGKLFAAPSGLNRHWVFCAEGGIASKNQTFLKNKKLL
jgi:hypothetical protein